MVTIGAAPHTCKGVGNAALKVPDFPTGGVALAFTDLATNYTFILLNPLANLMLGFLCPVRGIP
jgi:hypothetical protein